MRDVWTPAVESTGTAAIPKEFRASWETRLTPRGPTPTTWRPSPATRSTPRPSTTGRPNRSSTSSRRPSVELKVSSRSHRRGLNRRFAGACGWKPSASQAEGRGFETRRPLFGAPGNPGLSLFSCEVPPGMCLGFATGRSCGALARACGRGVLARRGPRRALHHGLAAVSDRGEDATPDRPDPPPLARSRPQDEPCGTSALGRVPPRPPLPLSGSGRRTRSHPDPGRDPRPLRAHLGRSSPPGKGSARCPSAELWPLSTGTRGHAGIQLRAALPTLLDLGSKQQRGSSRPTLNCLY